MQNCEAMILFYAVFTVSASVFGQIPLEQQLKCRLCNRATTLSDCNTFALCDNRTEYCYMDELITDQLTVVYTGGCRSIDVCNALTGNGKRNDLTACSQCCDTEDCNRKLCSIKQEVLNISQCFSCNHDDSDQLEVTDPNSCITLTVCQSDQICYTGEEVIDEKHSHFYYGCQNKRACVMLMNAAYKDYHICDRNITQPPGGVTWYEYCGDRRYQKRSRAVCHSCCDGNACNYGSCHQQNVKRFMLADQGKFDMQTLKLI